MLSMLGGIVGDDRGAARDERVREGVERSSIRRRGTTSFFMNNALKQDLELVLVLLAVDDRVGGRLDRRT